MAIDILKQTAKMLNEKTRKMEIKIRNDVTEHLDALFDGYNLCQK